jgi:hypothetical protein
MPFNRVAWFFVCFLALAAPQTGRAAALEASSEAAPDERSLVTLFKQAAGALSLDAWAAPPPAAERGTQRLAGPLEPAAWNPPEAAPEFSFTEAAMLANPNPEDTPERLGSCILFVLMLGALLRFLTSPACYDFIADVYYPRSY